MDTFDNYDTAYLKLEKPVPFSLAFLEGGKKTKSFWGAVLALRQALYQLRPTSSPFLLYFSNMVLHFCLGWA
jgi:hypothetical protein